MIKALARKASCQDVKFIEIWLLSSWKFHCWHSFGLVVVAKIIVFSFFPFIFSVYASIFHLRTTVCFSAWSFPLIWHGIKMNSCFRLWPWLECVLGISVYINLANDKEALSGALSCPRWRGWQAVPCLQWLCPPISAWQFMLTQWLEGHADAFTFLELWSITVLRSPRLYSRTPLARILTTKKGILERFEDMLRDIWRVQQCLCGVSP